MLPVTDLYESGGVAPYAQYMRDKLNKCHVCGQTWVGVQRALCPECARIQDEKDAFERGN